MKQVAYAFAVLVLSGCFLQQTKPSPTTQSGGDPIEGVVSITDLKGPVTGGLFSGKFYAKGRSADFRGRIKSRPEEMSCKIFREPRAVSRALVSVGKLTFGSALQNLGVEVPETQDHAYVKELAPDFPSGVYTVVASGRENLQSFGDHVVMPEQLQDVTVNGQAFGSSSVLIRKGDDLVATWREPAVPNENHISILNVGVRTATEIITLYCLGLEKSYPTAGGNKVWKIPASYLADLPADKDAEIAVTRLILRGWILANLDVQFQGIRTHFTAAEVGE
jgi:hypothetical protein